MAAIIAQMTRANRKRKKSGIHIGIGKWVYEIGPFPERYEPEVVFV